MKVFNNLKFVVLTNIFLLNYSFAKGIIRYKYFAETSRLEGSCGKIYSINTYTLTQNKVLLGLHRFDVSITYGAITNAEVGIKFNLNEQQDITKINKNITLISPYIKYKIIDSSFDLPINMAVGIYRTTMFMAVEKTFPEIYSTSTLLNFFLSFTEKQKFAYTLSVSKYTKWIEFIIDINPINNLYAVGSRALLTPDIKLNLFITDIKNISNLLFTNFVFGISIKI